MTCTCTAALHSSRSAPSLRSEVFRSRRSDCTRILVCCLRCTEPLAVAIDFTLEGSWRAFIEYGFGKLGLSRIVAGANANNIASNRVIQKLGFVWVRSGEGGGHSWHDYELRNPSQT